MQELMTNFKNKYGQTIPLPKIYQDEDSSDNKGLTLGDGTRHEKKTPGGGGGKGGGGKGGGGKGGGGKGGGRQGGDGSTGAKPGPSQGGGSGTGGRQPGKQGHDDDGNDDDPNKCRKTGGEGGPSRPTVACKEPCKSGTAYPPVN